MSAKKPTKARVCLGAFAGAHGVRGEAKAKTFTAAPENVALYGPVETEDGKRRFILRIVRVLKPDLVIVSAPEIESREDAASLAGVKFYVDRAALPVAAGDEFYIEDLIGLAALAEDGARLGEVVAVHNFGAGDIIEIAAAAGETGAATARAKKSGAKGSLMVPFMSATVPSVDLARGRLTIAAGALADNGGPGAPRLDDETGEIVSDDLSVNLDAMREEDS